MHAVNNFDSLKLLAKGIGVAVVFTLPFTACNAVFFVLPMNGGGRISPEIYFASLAAFLVSEGLAVGFVAPRWWGLAPVASWLVIAVGLYFAPILAPFLALLSLASAYGGLRARRWMSALLARRSSGP